MLCLKIPFFADNFYQLYFHFQEWCCISPSPHFVSSWVKFFFLLFILVESWRKKGWRRAAKNQIWKERRRVEEINQKRGSNKTEEAIRRRRGTEGISWTARREGGERARSDSTRGRSPFFISFYWVSKDLKATNCRRPLEFVLEYSTLGDRSWSLLEGENLLWTESPNTFFEGGKNRQKSFFRLTVQFMKQGNFQ